ncbi:unnamed protein product [Lampetra planeri]
MEPSDLLHTGRGSQHLLATAAPSIKALPQGGCDQAGRDGHARRPAPKGAPEAAAAFATAAKAAEAAAQRRRRRHSPFIPSPHGARRQAARPARTGGASPAATARVVASALPAACPVKSEIIDGETREPPARNPAGDAPRPHLEQRHSLHHSEMATSRGWESGK